MESSDQFTEDCCKGSDHKCLKTDRPPIPHDVKDDVIPGTEGEEIRKRCSMCKLFLFIKAQNQITREISKWTDAEKKVWEKAVADWNAAQDINENKKNRDKQAYPPPILRVLENENVDNSIKDIIKSTFNDFIKSYRPSEQVPSQNMETVLPLKPAKRTTWWKRKFADSTATSSVSAPQSHSSAVMGTTSQDEIQEKVQLREVSALPSVSFLVKAKNYFKTNTEESSKPGSSSSAFVMKNYKELHPIARRNVCGLHDNSQTQQRPNEDTVPLNSSQGQCETSL